MTTKFTPMMVENWLYGEGGADLIIGDQNDVTRYHIVTESGPIDSDDFFTSHLTVVTESGADKLIALMATYLLNSTKRRSYRT